MKIANGVFIATGLILATGDMASAQDAGKGKTVFNQCMACHMLESAIVGPPLAGVVGRKAASVSGYSYSPLMKAAGDAGLTWSDAELVEYLKNPTEYLKKYVQDKGKEASGSTKMTFSLANEEQRKDVVAYLATQKGK